MNEGLEFIRMQNWPYVYNGGEGGYPKSPAILLKPCGEEGNSVLMSAVVEGDRVKRRLPHYYDGDFLLIEPRSIAWEARRASMGGGDI